MNYELPTTVEIGGKDYKIRSDYRAILDILEALGDPALEDGDKIACILTIFYPELPPMDNYEEAVKQCFRFINMNEDEPNKQAPKLMDWSQDILHIIPPINRVLGKEIRSLDYLHWWTFLAAYYEMGECLFSQIVSIRSKKIKGQQLEKWEKQWYKEHRELVDFKTNYTDAEKDLLAQWGVK